MENRITRRVIRAASTNSRAQGVYGNRTSAAVLLALSLAASSVACAGKTDGARGADTLRNDALARARVWTQTDIPRMNLRTGPTGRDAFPPGASVRCRYVDKDMSGSTPKFTCTLPNGDDVKVKYGRNNGEVYAEVAATRLLWALGFGADHMYPVSIRCTGCPADDTRAGERRDEGVVTYEIAAIERKMAGREIEDTKGSGWSWTELDDIAAERGGATIAERDALKLLAAMLQHTDSKREQQRLVCLSGTPPDRPCRRAFALISDLGRTFGKANAFNRDEPGSVNLQAWAESPIWEGARGCRAHLPKSITGTLEDPEISEGGRRFLASLLEQLSDRQLSDLFTVARFPTRADAAGDARGGSVGPWVDAFKAKVSEIRSRRCAA